MGYPTIGTGLSTRRDPEKQPLEGLVGHFVRYAEGVRASSPLYGRLLRGVADDPDLLALAGAAPRDQPAGLLFLAAVHYLLLQGGKQHPPLAAYYPSVVGAATPTGDPVPAFRSFCLGHQEEIRELIATRRVQTNEVGRSACLLPAFTLASGMKYGRPLALVEVGASAGLNLHFDHYAYDYGDDVPRGKAGSPVRISCSLRGLGRPPLDKVLPRVASRVGVDLHPVDVRDPDSRLWQRALVWPEHTGRAETLRRALEVARSTPPPVEPGNALTVLPGHLKAIPEEAVPCIFHTHALYQFAPQDRERMDVLLTELSMPRELLVRVAMEPSDAGHSVLSLHAYRYGYKEERRLAVCDYHGRWLAWRTRPT
jgi:hypothetical protein